MITTITDLSLFLSPCTFTSYLLSAWPATFTAMQVYRPVSATWAPRIRNNLPSLSIWALRPVRGLPSFSHEMAGLGRPSASHCKVTSPPRVTIFSCRLWVEELMEGRTVCSQEKDNTFTFRHLSIATSVFFHDLSIASTMFYQLSSKNTLW